MRIIQYELIVFELAHQIYDLNFLFCKRYLYSKHPNFKRMIHMAYKAKERLKIETVSSIRYYQVLSDMYRSFLNETQLKNWSFEDESLEQISHINCKDRFSVLMIGLCYKQSIVINRLLQKNLLRQHFKN